MESTLAEPSLYAIKAILVMDNDGNRLVSRYYDNAFPTIREQKVFEKNLFNKTHRANAEIVMFEGMTCVYRSSVDLFFYVVGNSNENELLLMNVLTVLFECVSQMLRKNVEKKMLLDRLDSVFLAIDEICDGGILLEADPVIVVSRAAVKQDDIPIGEQTVSQVLSIAKEQIGWSLLK